MPEEPGWARRTGTGLGINAGLSLACRLALGYLAGAEHVEHTNIMDHLAAGDVLQVASTVLPAFYSCIIGPNRTGGFVKNLYRMVAAVFWGYVAFSDSTSLISGIGEAMGNTGTSVYRWGEGLVSALSDSPNLAGTPLTGKEIVPAGLALIAGVVFDAKCSDFARNRRAGTGAHASI